jgi:hypothetical protein
MFKKLAVPVVALLLAPSALFAAQTGAAAESKPDPLAPLLFLEGRWKGEGKGPYGPYSYENVYERRGRWLLATSSLFPAGSREPLLRTTGTLGYDPEGRMVLYLFDEGGAYRFSGETTPDGVRFEWREGADWRRTRITRLPDGSIRFEGDIHIEKPPAGVPSDSHFESVAVKEGAKP